MTYPIAKLGEVAEFIRGITFKPDDVVPLDTDDAVVCMRTKNVQALLDCDDLLAVPSQFVRRKDQYLEEGDILVSSANSWNLVGKCCWIPRLPWRAAFGGFIAVLRGDSERVDRRYLYWWFASDRIQALLRSFGQKTTNISNLNIERCLGLDLPLPPLPEQRRIAAILDKADALRSRRREALAQLDRLAQSIFVEMFGDPVTNPKGWQQHPLNSACSVINDCPHSTPDWSESGQICLRTSNLTRGDWSWVDTRFVSEETFHERSKRGYIQAGDIVLSREGTVGIAAIVQPSMTVCMGQRLVQVRCDKRWLVPEYLLHHLLHVLEPSRISRLMVGSTAQHLNVKELKSLTTPLPPVELQRAFSERIQSIKSLQARQFKAASAVEEMFASLQHRAFRGEL